MDLDMYRENRRNTDFMQSHFPFHQDALRRLAFYLFDGAVRGAIGAARYSCSKTTLDARALNIGHNYGRFNVRAYPATPGFVHVGILAHLSNEKEQMLVKEPSFKRLAMPEEIALLFIAILGPFYLTCTATTLDGGFFG